MSPSHPIPSPLFPQTSDTYLSTVPVPYMYDVCPMYDIQVPYMYPSQQQHGSSQINHSLTQPKRNNKIQRSTSFHCRLTSLTFVTKKNGLRTEKSVHFSFRELRTSVCLQVPCASVGTSFFLIFLLFCSTKLLGSFFSFFLSTYFYVLVYLPCTCKREHMQNEWLMIADADADC